MSNFLNLCFKNNINTYFLILSICIILINQTVQQENATVQISSTVSILVSQTSPLTLPNNSTIPIETTLSIQQSTEQINAENSTTQISLSANSTAITSTAILAQNFTTSDTTTALSFSSTALPQNTSVVYNSSTFTSPLVNVSDSTTTLTTLTSTLTTTTKNISTIFIVNVDRDNTVTIAVLVVFALIGISIVSVVLFIFWRKSKESKQNVYESLADKLSNRGGSMWDINDTNFSGAPTSSSNVVDNHNINLNNSYKNLSQNPKNLQAPNSSIELQRRSPPSNTTLSNRTPSLSEFDNPVYDITDLQAATNNNYSYNINNSNPQSTTKKKNEDKMYETSF